MNQYLNEHESVTTWFCYVEATNVKSGGGADGIRVSRGPNPAVIDFLKNNLEHETKALHIFFYIIWSAEKL